MEIRAPVINQNCPWVNMGELTPHWVLLWSGQTPAEGSDTT